MSTQPWPDAAKILYCAIDQTVPGTTGGSVHVTAVAEGLAALGHEVHVLVTPGDGPFPAGGANPVQWIPMAPPFGARQLRWLRTGEVRRIVATLQPAVIIERVLQLRRRGSDGCHGGPRRNRPRGQRAGH